MNGREAQSAASTLRLRRFLRLLCSLLLLAVAVAIVLLGMERLRRIARDDRCRMHLHRVSVALALYHGSNDRLPPPYLTDDNGTPMHSWRSLVMFFLVNEKPYDFGVDEYKFSEPWDSPGNTRFRNGHEFYDYLCPNHAKGSRDASYLCVVGSALWPLPKKTGAYWNVANRPNPTEGGVFPSHGKAILFVELVESDIPWTKPADINLSELVSLLQNDPSGDQLCRCIRHVVAVDATGTSSILDTMRDLEEITKLVESEAAGQTELGHWGRESEAPERKPGP